MLADGGRISLGQQIAEAEREMQMRQRVYPGLVAQRKMRQSEADMLMARQRAIIRTLQWLQRHEVRIRAALSEEAADEGVR